MLSPRQFVVFTKVHYASPEGEAVGSVFGDCLVSQPGGISFYSGKSCVAILSESHLMIGPRQVGRSALRKDRPCWYDPTDKGVMLPAEHPLRTVLRPLPIPIEAGI